MADGRRGFVGLEGGVGRVQSHPQIRVVPNLLHCSGDLFLRGLDADFRQARGQLFPQYLVGESHGLGRVNGEVGGGDAMDEGDARLLQLFLHSGLGALGQAALDGFQPRCQDVEGQRVLQVRLVPVPEKLHEELSPGTNYLRILPHALLQQASQVPRGLRNFVVVVRGAGVAHGDVGRSD